MSDALIGAVGSGIASFDAGIEAAQREAVTYALRFAYRAATDLYAQAGGQWYDYYRRQLRFLGWDAQPAEHAWNPDTSRIAVTDRACKAISRQSEYFGALAQRAADALKVVPEAGELVQRHARGHRHGMFQMLPCRKRQVPSGVSQIEMLIYHEEVDLSASGGLFSATQPPLLTTVHIALVRFDVRSFQATHLPKIRERFGKVKGDYLAMILR